MSVLILCSEPRKAKTSYFLALWVPENRLSLTSGLN